MIYYGINVSFENFYCFQSLDINICLKIYLLYQVRFIKLTICKNLLFLVSGHKDMVRNTRIWLKVLRFYLFY